MVKYYASFLHRIHMDMDIDPWSEAGAAKWTRSCRNREGEEQIGYEYGTINVLVVYLFNFKWFM